MAKFTGKQMNDIQNRKTSNDVFSTPSGLVRELLALTPCSLAQTVLDPFKGDGAFFNAFDHAGREWCEITEGRDFFEWTSNVDWVISNPPFSKLSPIITHTLSIAQEGFAYIMPTYSMTYRRLKEIEDAGFHMTSMVVFKNPKEWKIGFQMVYVVFERSRRVRTRTNDVVLLQS